MQTTTHARPSEAELAQAIKVMRAVVTDPETGWSRERAEFVSDLLDTWKSELRQNLYHAACDGEKA